MAKRRTNKSILEMLNAPAPTSKAKGKRGRPKGSKNKPKYLEGAFSEIPATHPSQKRRRGRPKGSKSKQYQPTRAQFQPHLSGRRRGRPKGSKNKTKTVDGVLSKKGKIKVTLHGTIG